jgi:hypothetical protein
VVRVHLKVWKRIELWKVMDADDPLARCRALVASDEASPESLARQLPAGSAATDLQRQEAERLRNEIEASRHAAWFQALSASSAARCAPNVDAELESGPL